MAIAGSAQIRRILRQRFGIAARKVAIRTDIPMFWRTLLWIVVLSTSLALGRWAYDLGMRFAGFDRHESAVEMERLRAKIVSLEAELEKVQSVARSSNSRIQLETTTHDSLAVQIKMLQRENAALKEDVAVFEGLVSGVMPASGARIARAAIESTGKSSTYRFRVLVVSSSLARAGKEIRGELQFQLKTRLRGKDATISIPDSGQDGSAFRFVVRQFQRVEGEFAVPEGSSLVSGEVRLLQDGVVSSRQFISL